MLPLAILVVCIFSYPAELIQGSLIDAGLSSAQNILLLNLHNDFRNQVAGGRVPRQPKAANMAQLTWDNELANYAQNWVKNCEFEHSPSRNSRGEYMGENLAQIMSSQFKLDSSTLKSLATLWFDEHKDYKMGSGFSYNTGHYTQAVWAKSTKVGCGLAVCNQGRWKNILLSCNYWPAGNFRGQNPYERGSKNCKKYGMSDSRSYENLCVEW